MIIWNEIAALWSMHDILILSGALSGFWNQIKYKYLLTHMWKCTWWNITSTQIKFPQDLHGMLDSTFLMKDDTFIRKS